MSTPTLEETLRYLKAMAHETRLRLLGILAAGEYSVGDLADLLELKEPTISHHLALMHEVGLVKMEPIGTSHFYSLNQATVERLSRELLSPARVAAISAEAGGADPWEQKVLRSFLDGDTLTQIPAQRKKRLVILRWLAARLEPGRTYGELELSALLKRHHPDAATLRRELVAEGLLRREGSAYQL